MASGILPPELKSIEQLFTGDARFRVPQYQRSFAWGADEVEELWDDVLAAMGRKNDYFIGTLVLQSNKQGLFEIIDGQQRLTCISMIFSAVRNAFRARNDSREEKVFAGFLGARDFTRDSLPKPKLELNKVNNETFVKFVIESENYNKVEKALKNKSIDRSNRLLLEAYKFFLGKVTTETAKKGTDSDEFLVPLIDCLRTSIKLITIPVMTDEDANLFFESLNARGKELAVSDLVKNRLYSEAQDQVVRAQQLWETMEAELTRRPIPEYLRHYWIAKKAEGKYPVVREKKLYRAIASEVGGQKQKTIQLLKDLSERAQDYAKIDDYSLWPDDASYDKSFEDNLSELRLFRILQCNPLLLNAIQVFKTPKAIAKTFRIVANFSFRYYIIGNQSPGNLERESAKIAGGVRDRTLTSPNDVANALRAINPDPTFRADFELATLPKSRARVSRYLLAKLNDHLAKQSSKSGGESIANPDAKTVNLEHVLPQSVPPLWKSNFSSGAEPSEYIHRIGNLTLLNAKVNADAANKTFQDKIKLALKQSNLPINAYFRQSLTKWGEKEIEQRQKEMARLALDVWKL